MAERKTSKRNPASATPEPKHARRPAARAASRSLADPVAFREPDLEVPGPVTGTAPPKTGDRKRPGARASARAGERTVSSQAATSGAHARSTDRAPAGLEADHELSSLLYDVDGADGDADARRRAADAIGRIAARLHAEAPASAEPDDGVLRSARHLLSTDYYLKQWGRLGMRGRSEQVDDFGLDRTYEARLQPMLDALYEKYFRVGVSGADQIPGEGAALLVCNHSGALPWDGVMLKTALRRQCEPARTLRWLTDDFVFHSPFVGAWLNRIGAVRACPENAERLLERGELLAAFPEGVKGIGKIYRERHRLERFGRGGHLKLALRLGVPLIPVAIVGGEESFPLLYKVRAFAKVLDLPFIPVTPTFPWLGPLGLVPLPTRWRIVIGEPMQELAGLPARAANDSVLITELNERLRARVQALLEQGLNERGPHAFA
jgi:1-acyl-sn-glycerol-3-phosphate acyltransferase